jgi:hypothetical protein
MADIVRVMQFMPDDYHARQKFIRLFQEMTEAVSKLQQADGLWRASLLDPEHFPARETSGSELFCYTLAGGGSTTQSLTGKPILLLLKRPGKDRLAGSMEPTGWVGCSYTVMEHALSGNPPQGWESLMIVILVVGGFQMLMMEILGEYLWPALDGSRRRPKYLIEETTES